jgi:hypothetical protein
MKLHLNKIQDLKNSESKISTSILKNTENYTSQLIDLNNTLFNFSVLESKSENINYFDNKKTFMNEQNCILCFKNQLCTKMGVCRNCFFTKEDLTDRNINKENNLDTERNIIKNNHELMSFNKFDLDLKGNASGNDVFPKYDEDCQKGEAEINNKFTNKNGNAMVDLNFFKMKNHIGNNYNINPNIDSKISFSNNLINNNDNFHKLNLKSDTLIDQRNENFAKRNLNNDNKNTNKNEKQRNFNNNDNINHKILNLGSNHISESLSRINETLNYNKNINENRFESKLVKIKLDNIENQYDSFAKEKLSKSSDHFIRNSLNNSISSNNINKPIKIIKADFNKDNTARLSNREMKITIRNEFKIPSANITINPKSFVTKNVELNLKSDKENTEIKTVILKNPTIKRTNTRNNKVMNKNASNFKD